MSQHNQPVFHRLMNQVKINQYTKCWEWYGALFRGYGIITIKKKTHRVHRIIYKYFYGSIPKDKPFILHTCDNRQCCNPMHLYAGTSKDNAQDRLKRNPDSWPKTKRNIGEKHGRTKLTEKQVLEIRASKEKLRILAKRYNVGIAAISNIKTRRTWQHI